jgi:hypothetical protein
MYQREEPHSRFPNETHGHGIRDLLSLESEPSLALRTGSKLAPLSLVEPPDEWLTIREHVPEIAGDRQG